MENPGFRENASSFGSEVAEQKRRRIAWEADAIAKARASVAAGRTIDSEEINAWIDSLGTDHELPPPRSGR